jgi:5-oxoprolinase (ATP-hydrolysing)
VDGQGKSLSPVFGLQTLITTQGDRLVIETPGGGAWGALDEDGHAPDAEHRKEWTARGSLAEREAKQAGF